MATNIAGIVASAEDTSAGVGDALQAIDDLARTSSELQRLVAHFTVA